MDIKYGLKKAEIWIKKLKMAKYGPKYGLKIAKI
jgi:hypothetical protein